MWYFSWILGIGAALSFGIINVLWLESNQPTEALRSKAQLKGDARGSVSD